MEIEAELKHVSLENSTEDGNDVQNEYAVACNNFPASGKDQLSFNKGDRVKIIQKTNDSWWWVELNGCYGYVPVNHFKDTDDSSAWQNDEYFGNYGHLKLHHEMLSDRPRTLAYMKAIVCNSDYLNGKVIVDVGCGTGILSMMCAKYAEPKKVYAIEASEMAQHTREVIEQNRMSDKIDVINAYAEEVQLKEKVDVIISEWMGTILLFEMMIESVIHVRDRFLKEDGIMWPSTASLFLVPCSAQAQFSDKVDFWDTQFGFDFSCLKSVAKEDILCKPFYDYVLPKDDCLSDEVELYKLNMKTVTLQYLEQFSCEFGFSIKRDGMMHGFCTWFEVGFEPSNPNGEEVLLNTGPDHKLTHWKQNLFLLDEPLSVRKGHRVSGVATFTRNPDYRRHLRAELDFTLSSGSDVVSQCKKMFYIWR